MEKGIILKRLKIIADLNAELKKMKEMYNEMLESDNNYQEIMERISKTADEIRIEKDTVLSNSSYRAVANEIKEKRTELKEALSQDLVDYYRESGTLEIEDVDGNIRRMKFSVRLVN